MAGYWKIKLTIKTVFLLLGLVLVSLMAGTTHKSIELSPVSGYNINDGLPKLYLQIASEKMYVDQPFSIRLELSEAADLYGYSVDMAYDPSVVSIKDVKPIGAFKGRTVVQPVKQLDNVNGRLSFVEMLLGKAEGQKGRTELVEITLCSLKEGRLSIEIFPDNNGIRLSNSDVITLVVQLVNDEAKIIPFESDASNLYILP